MALTVKTGATLTGGADTVLAAAGDQPGKRVYIAPGHTRLTPYTIEFTTSPPSGSGPTINQVARAGMKITAAAASVEEGCCTVKQGAVVLDFGMRWSLNQEAALVTAALAMLKALVYEPSFESFLVNGTMPQD